MSVFTNASDAAREEADDYIRAVLSLVGDRDPLTILQELPEAARELASGVTLDQLRRPERPGKWSMLEVLAHLADSDLVWACRLRTVLAEADPVLTGYDQDRWVERLRYRDWPLEEVLEAIDYQRPRNLRLLAGLSGEERAREGRHDERGTESIDHMIRLYAGHDLVHRNQLARIRAAVLEDNRTTRQGE